MTEEICIWHKVNVKESWRNLLACQLSKFNHKLLAICSVIYRVLSITEFEKLSVVVNRYKFTEITFFKFFQHFIKCENMLQGLLTKSTKKVSTNIQNTIVSQHDSYVYLFTTTLSKTKL